MLECFFQSIRVQTQMAMTSSPAITVQVSFVHDVRVFCMLLASYLCGYGFTDSLNLVYSAFAGELEPHVFEAIFGL